MNVGRMGFPTLSYTPGSTIGIPFLRLEAVCQNVWMEILLKLVTISLVSASWQLTRGLEWMYCKQTPTWRVRVILLMQGGKTHLQVDDLKSIFIIWTLA